MEPILEVAWLPNGEILKIIELPIMANTKKDKTTTKDEKGLSYRIVPDMTLKELRETKLWLKRQVDIIENRMSQLVKAKISKLKEGRKNV